jgi:DNA-binding response OmpR family regulator
MQRAGVVGPIETARDGRAALDYFKGTGTFGNRNDHPLPRLVLLDLKLPYITGLDVLRWIRRQDRFKSLIIVVLSASQSPDDVATAYRCGADAYFVKPGTLNELDTVARKIRDWWIDASHPSDPGGSSPALKSKGFESGHGLEESAAP